MGIAKPVESRDRVPVLLIEDEATDAMRVRRCLRRTPYQVDHASTLRAGLDRLSKRDVAAVLLDLHLPDADGIETVEELVARLLEHDLDIPIVVVTGASESEMAESALRAGAQDYVTKDQIDSPAVLERALRYARERHAAQARQRELERRIQHAEYLEGLGVLSAGLASGLRSLVGDVTDQLDAALIGLDEHAAPSVLRKHLIAIRKSVLATDEMGRRLQSWIGTGENETAIDLAAFLLDRLDVLESMVGKRAELLCDTSSGLPRVRCNPFELRQLLVVLVLNAVEAIAGAGSIQIRADVLDADAEFLASCENGAGLAPGRYVTLSVSDNGEGLPAAARAHLFDPFFTTRVPGRGVGLFFALSIVRRRGGAIRALSERGRGSCFTVLLPALPEGD